ncbi:MAG: SLC13 family permease [Balneolaceae bacterium]
MTYLPAIWTLLILALLVWALVREWVRPELAFLTALGLFLGSGVVTPEQAFSGFSNEAVFTVGSLFVVAAGVQHTRALGFVERQLLPDEGSLSGALARLMGTTMSLSAFLNNTPIVAMLIPQVQLWSERSGHAVSKLLIPLSYAAITGGVITLVGTSTNLIVSGMLSERGFAPFGFFELTWIGLPAALLVFLWFVFFGHRTLPDRSRKSNGNGTNERYQFDLEVPEDSPLSGQRVREAGLWSLDQAFLMHIHREGKTMSPIGPNHTVQPGDLLTFVGEIRQVDDLAHRKGLVRAVPLLNREGKTDEEFTLYEAVLSSSSPLIGRTLQETRFLDRYHGVVVGIQRRDENFHGSIGEIPLRPGDLLLIEADEGFDDRWNGIKEEFYLVTPREFRTPPATRKAPLALGILILVVGLAASGWVSITISAFLGALLVILTGCLPYRQLYGALNLPILLVIASAIGLGQAIEQSGLALGGATLLLENVAPLGVIAVIIALYITTNLLTEIITNNAAAVLMLPVGMMTATEMGLEPHAAAVTVAVAASASFLTPIGYQTNLMVMGAGEYRFTDYIRAGLPVTLILMSLTVTMIWYRWI